MTLPPELLDRILCADCMDPEVGLPSLPDGCVDAVITDPPYGVDIAAWDVAPSLKFRDHCLRIATGPVVMFGAASVRSLRAFVELEPDRMLVWAPKVTMSKTSANSMYYHWHAIWCWRLPKEQSGSHSDVLRHATEMGAWWFHPCTKPLPLMAALVGFCPEDGTVLDPYMGSATTAVACIETGRHFLGYEIDPTYHAICEKRIAKARLQPRLFEPELVSAPEPLTLAGMGDYDGT